MLIISFDLTVTDVFTCHKCFTNEWDTNYKKSQNNINAWNYIVRSLQFIVTFLEYFVVIWAFLGHSLMYQKSPPTNWSVYCIIRTVINCSVFSNWLEQEQLFFFVFRAEANPVLPDLIHIPLIHSRMPPAGSSYSIWSQGDGNLLLDCLLPNGVIIQLTVQKDSLILDIKKVCGSCY